MSIAVHTQESHAVAAKGQKAGAAVDVAMEDVENRGACETKQQGDGNGKQQHVDVSVSFVRRLSPGQT
jgi:hypothetical protein